MLLKDWSTPKKRDGQGTTRYPDTLARVSGRYMTRFLSSCDVLFISPYVIQTSAGTPQCDRGFRIQRYDHLNFFAEILSVQQCRLTLLLYSSACVSNMHSIAYL